MILARRVLRRCIKAATFTLFFALAVTGFGRASAETSIPGGGVIMSPSNVNQLRITNSVREPFRAPNLQPPCADVSISNSITTRRNVSVTAPILVTDLTGAGVLSFDFNLTYDPAILTAPTVSNAGTISSPMVITVNPNTPGVLRVSGYHHDFVAGAGTLLNINFTAIGPIGSGSNLVLSPFALNEGNPCSVVSNGHVTIISGTISGAVTYANAQAPPVPVPNVLLSATGSVTTSTNSNFSGLYSFGGFGAGAYTVTPSKIGDVNGITGFDSALIAQHIVLLIVLSPTQLLAADVSQNSVVTSFDAALIAQYVVAIPNVGITGSWIFSPANRGYADVESDFNAQNYDAILMGEVSGNWIAPTMRTTATLPAAAVLPVTAPTITVLPDQTITIPVTCGDTTGLNVLAYQFDLIYDPTVIVPQANPISTVGTISEGMLPIFNPISPGRLKVVLFTATPRMGAGLLLNLKFTAVGTPGSASPLTWEDFKWDEGNPAALAANGHVRLLSPTVSSGVVRGRVLTATGQPASYTRVTLTALNGATSTVTANGFGFYEFAGVAAGQTYTLSTDGRRTIISPRLLTVGGDVTELDLIGDP